MAGELSDTIDKAFDAEKQSDYRSSRIGASLVGNPCEAFLALSIRGFPEVKSSPKLMRIFRDGHRIENVVIADLRKAGHTILDKDPMTGKQYMWDKHNGHIVFYADGIVEGETTSSLLEVKSMNDAMWSKFKDRGVRVSHPKYYDQLQMGMGLSGYRKAILIAYNKNTSEYWDQVIEYDEIQYYHLLARAERVLMGAHERVAKDQSDWRCKDCFKRDSCWGNNDVPKDKRTCKHSKLAASGWECSNGCKDQCMNWERFEPKARDK